LEKKEESSGFDVFFVFGREEKNSEFIQVESKTQESLSFSSFSFFFLVWRFLGPFIAPTRFLRQWPYKGHPLQKASNQVDLYTPKKILTS